MNADYERVLQAREWVIELVACLNDMTDKQRQFVEQMNERFEQYGDETFVSQSQWAWIEALAKKHLRVTA